MNEEGELLAGSHLPSSYFAMNPSASLCTPDADPLDFTLSELRNINQSLYEALYEARHAQSAAEVALDAIKLALKEETARRERAEDEIRALLRMNNRLPSTIQTLGAPVKQNNSEAITTLDKVDFAVLSPEKDQFQANGSSHPLYALPKQPVVTIPGNAVHSTQPILYDVLEHQRAQYQSYGYPENEQDFATMTSTSRTDLGGADDTEAPANGGRRKVILAAHAADGGFDVGQASGRPNPANNIMATSAAHSRVFTNCRDVTNRTISMPYQCRPQWAILQNRPLFDNDTELARARSQQSGHQPYSPFWQHPVRYMPASDEKNLCRTLIIDFLPLDTTMRDVLGLIRGGALESIQMFPPIGIVTDFMTARVVFHYELPADDMYIHWQKYGLTVRNQNIRVLQLGYTYPKNRQLDEDVFIRCYTRILLIDNIGDRAIQRLPAYLNRQIKMGFIVEIGQADDGITMVEFTSVAEAAKAMRAMQAEEMFYGAVFDFEDDYCAEGSYAY